MSNAYIRAYMISGGIEDYKEPKHKEVHVPSRIILFDIETTTDSSKTPLYGFYIVVNENCLEECGFIFNEDLITDEEYNLLERSLLRFTINVTEELSLSDTSGWPRNFTIQQFNNHLYKFWRGEGCVTVGHNLAFDLTRIARLYSASRKHHNGINVKLCTHEYGKYNRCSHHPMMLIEHVGKGRNFMSIPSLFPKEDTTKLTETYGNARFVDTITLGGALLGDYLSLDNLGKVLNLPPELRKSKRPNSFTNICEPRSITTKQDIAYAQQDVIATFACYRELCKLHSELNLERPIWQLFSPASLDKSLLRQMGIRPFVKQHTYFSQKLMAQSMAAYYGGRTEVPIRQSSALGLLNDFKQQYATAQILMHIFNLTVTEHITTKDVTKWVQELVTKPADELLSFLQDPANWPLLVCLVKVSPVNEHRLPIRDYYNNDYLSTGLPFFRSCVDAVYCLGDVLADALFRTWAPDEIVEAHSFTPSKQHYPTKEVHFLGATLNAEQEDPLLTIGNLRNRYKQLYNETGDTQYRLLHDSLKRMLTAFSGMHMELDVITHDKPVQVKLCDIDGNVHTALTKHVERPGSYFSPFGCFITAGGRLLLAIAEKLFNIQRVYHAMADTDSIFPVLPMDIRNEYVTPGAETPECPICHDKGRTIILDDRYICVDHPERRLSVEEFIAINEDVRNWFRELSPYEGKPHILELEGENYVTKDDGTQTIEPLQFIGIRSKSYALFRMRDGKPDIVKLSRHGLGGIVAPYDNNNSPYKDVIPEPSISLEKLGCGRWEYDIWWMFIYSKIHGIYNSMLDDAEFDVPILHKVTASTFHLVRQFSGVNVKPFDFFTLLQVSKIDGLGFYRADVKDPKKRRDKVSTNNHDSLYYSSALSYTDFNMSEVRSTKDNSIAPSDILFTTLGDYLKDFFAKGESKYSNFDSSGIMNVRHTSINNLVYMGKDNDPLSVELTYESAGMLGQREPNILIDSTQQLQTVSVSEAAEITGKSKRTIDRRRRIIKEGKITKDLPEINNSIRESQDNSQLNARGYIDLILGYDIPLQRIADELKVPINTLYSIKSGKRPGVSLLPKLRAKALEYKLLKAKRKGK